MSKEFDKLENEKVKSSFELNNGKKKFITKLKLNKKDIKSNGGNYKFKKRFILIRWYEQLTKKIRLAYHRIILWFFNTKNTQENEIDT